VRERSESFADHFGQAKLFFNSQTPEEKSHIVKALRFELGKVETTAIRVRMLGLLSQVDAQLAEKVALGLGASVPPIPEFPANKGVSPENEGGNQEPKTVESSISASEALSMVKNPTNSPTIESRKVAILCSDGVSEAAVMNIKRALKKQGAKGCVIAPHLGSVVTDADGALAAEFSFLTASSVLFDAVYVPHGIGLNVLAENDDALEYLNDAYKHCKVIGADGEASELLSATTFASKLTNDDPGIIITSEVGSEAFAQEFIDAMAMHRFWDREPNLYI
jgi:catalase